MGIGNVLNIGQSGMTVAKQGIATAGHNIANANTPGYTRQKVHQTAGTAISGPGAANQNGQGAYVDTIARVNDEYLDKSLRKASQQQKHFEEKDLVFKQIEDSFNELNGEGLIDS